MTDPRTQAIEAIRYLKGDDDDPALASCADYVDAVWPIVEAAVRASVLSDEAIEALRLIDAHGCENYTGGIRCWETSRVRGGKYLADSWCYPCVAAAALGVVSSESEKPEPEWLATHRQQEQDSMGQGI